MCFFPSDETHLTSTRVLYAGDVRKSRKRLPFGAQPVRLRGLRAFAVSHDLGRYGQATVDWSRDCGS